MSMVRTKISATFSQLCKRCYSTANSSYPFSSSVTVPSPSPPSPSQIPPKTASLLSTLNTHLSSLDPSSSSLIPLFSRRSPTRVLPGSVLTVTSYSTPPSASNPSPSLTTFSGVLIGVRRRNEGRDLSIRLRNLVGRTGVEVAFKVFSPLVKEIKVVQRAETSGPLLATAGAKEGERRKPVIKASKRAKMYFVRDQPNRLTGVAGIIKQQREREMQAENRKGARR
ncbi:hypothetical protein T439DRAFT_342289 [Meredithblackwellia eburnea MCA 4105]